MDPAEDKLEAWVEVFLRVNKEVYKTLEDYQESVPNSQEEAQLWIQYVWLSEELKRYREELGDEVSDFLLGYECFDGAVSFITERVRRFLKSRQSAVDKGSKCLSEGDGLHGC